MSKFREDFEESFDKALGFDIEHLCGIGKSFRSLQMKSALFSIKWILDRLSKDGEFSTEQRGYLSRLLREMDS